MSFITAAVIGSAVVSTASSLAAAKKQRKAGKAQRAADRLQNWQNQMQQLRDYQVGVSTAGVAWEGSGASLESSGAQGSRSAMGSQLAGNLDMMARGAQLSNKYASAMNDANRWQGIASLANTVGSVAAAYGSIKPNNVPEFQNLPDYGTVPEGGTRVYGIPPPPGSGGA
jgi:hypothetical protein